MSKPVFKDWMSTTIRRNRRSYFLACLALLPVFMILGWAGAVMFSASGESALRPAIATAVMTALPMAAWLNLSAQRLRDVGLSGWWFVVFIPGYFSDVIAAAFPTAAVIIFADIVGIGGFILFIALLIAPGNKGKNRFGADPLKAKAK